MKLDEKLDKINSMSNQELLDENKKILGHNHPWVKRLEGMLQFEDYSYYVGTEITCNRMPKKYSKWLEDRKS